MKYLIGCAAVALLSACGVGTESGADKPDVAAETSDAAANTPGEYTLPFGLAMAPNTRLVDGSSYTVGGMVESSASLATTGEGKAALNFYEAELTKAGWEVYSRSGDPAKPFFAAKKDDLRIQASLFGSGDGLIGGETDVRLTAKYPE